MNKRKDFIKNNGLAASGMILLLVTFAIAIAGCSNTVEETVTCIQLDPLHKVFKEELYFVETPDTAAVAKGETATFQFVLRGTCPIRNLKIEAGNLIRGDRQISVSEKAFVEYIRAGNHAEKLSRDAVLPISDLYPDCLTEVEYMDIPSMSNQPLWIGYDIPRDAVSGDYTANLVFSGTTKGKPFKINKQINVRVYNVTLPEQTLWVTNWFTLSGLSRMNGNERVEPYSDRYWELLKELAHVMRDHRQNTYLLGRDLVKVEYTGTQFTFDFTNFDKTVELLIGEGGLKRIEGGHLGGGLQGWGTEFGVSVPKTGLRPFDNDTVQQYLSQYLPALYNHLESKGWTKLYIQHIADEPTEKNAQSYIRIAEMVRKHIPGVKIIDAVETSRLANTVNVWTPMLNLYHNEYPFFQERQTAGDEVWFYTCVFPQGNYANRFLELPLVQTRYLHWINYRYGSTGYLHWGLNYWTMNRTNDAAVNTWPGGDSWIVYPAEGKVYSSVRFKAMRDGIADYELLKLLEQTNPDMARELASEVIRGFDNYNSNIRAFRLTRLKLLRALS